jgi:virginiamycin A acetyltransferase
MPNRAPTGPSPATSYPLPANQRLVFLKNLIRNPNIIVGEYT